MFTGLKSQQQAFRLDLSLHYKGAFSDTTWNFIQFHKGNLERWVCCAWNATAPIWQSQLCLVEYASGECSLENTPASVHMKASGHQGNLQAHCTRGWWVEREEKGDTGGGKRIVTALCCSWWWSFCILCMYVRTYHHSVPHYCTYICHQPHNLQLMDVWSGRCDHAGGWVWCQGGYLLHFVCVVCGQRGKGSNKEGYMWYKYEVWLLWTSLLQSSQLLVVYCLMG